MTGIRLRAPTRPGLNIPLLVTGAPARTGRVVTLGPIARARPGGGVAPRGELTAPPPPPVQVLAPRPERAIQTRTRPGPTIPVPGSEHGVRTVSLGPLPRVEPLVEVTPHAQSGALQVGILGGSKTTVSMTPADLTKGPRTDITLFRIIDLDAGEY